VRRGEDSTRSRACRDRENNPNFARWTARAGNTGDVGLTDDRARRLSAIRRVDANLKFSRLPVEPDPARGSASVTARRHRQRVGAVRERAAGSLVRQNENDGRAFRRTCIVSHFHRRFTRCRLRDIIDHILPGDHHDF